jgi:hypothetical protein
VALTFDLWNTPPYVKVGFYVTTLYDEGEPYAEDRGMSFCYAAKTELPPELEYFSFQEDDRLKEGPRPSDLNK